MPKKEGLADIHELKNLGIPVNHDLDQEIDSYFTSTKPGPKDTDILSEPEHSNTDIELCKIKTFGFKDGILQHNMPCPICLKRPAT